MIQLILIVLSIISPNNNLTATNNSHSIITLQSNIDLGENLDTGGETTQTPPKK